MATNERSLEVAGVDLTGQNHVCAFFNTMDEEHRVLRSFYLGGFEQSEKATHIVEFANRESLFEAAHRCRRKCTRVDGRRPAGGAPVDRHACA
jgi:hypothetical protein